MYSVRCLSKICITFSIFLFGIIPAKALHFTIIESQSYLSTDMMDTKWQGILATAGHTSSILPQSTLDNTSFFSATDILVISSGSIALPVNRVNTVLQFLQSGKNVYLQSEYDCSLSSNQAFAFLVNNLGGTFTWGGTTNGILQMNILGSVATTPNSVSNLSYFNFGCFGSGCGVQYFMEQNTKFYGFFFCPSTPNYGSLLSSTDQDWINNSSNPPLLENIIMHLSNPALCSPSTFTPLNLGNDTTLCDGSIYTLNASNSNATYLWQDGSVNPTFDVSSSGSYWVQVSNNCGVFRDTIQINFAPAPTINLGNDTMVCAGQPIILNATTPGATYTWQDGSNNPTLQPIFSGIYSVSVNVGGCITKDTIIVNFFPSPVVNLGNDTTLCDGEGLLLNATTFSATSYTWQDNSSLPTYWVTNPGFYSVQVNTPCGLINDLIFIDFKPAPIVDLGNDTILCTGTSLLLNASTPGATYLWPDNSTLPTLLASEAGLFTVEVTANGCTTRDTIDITYRQTPQINLGEDTKLCSNESISYDFTTPGASYIWQDNSTEPTYLINKKGWYWVAVTLQNCTGTDTIFVDYFDYSCNCNVFVPTAFTPNNDGRNDEFKYLASFGNIEFQEFKVFNRWGKAAFIAQNSNDAWDGKINGTEAEIDTYYYYLKYKCNITGRDYFLKGDFILIR
ncbi:MAG: gliding motility-associated C-terminal domain-containing protein [Bacteroidetes bacterium]|nr:gliding motility-associated C-terminal domain-containing protein [Bacteroidota bacterium]